MQIASMMVKGLFMYCFLLTFYNQLLRTDYSLTDTLDRYSPKDWEWVLLFEVWGARASWDFLCLPQRYGVL